MQKIGVVFVCKVFFITTKFDFEKLNTKSWLDLNIFLGSTISSYPKVSIYNIIILKLPTLKVWVYKTVVYATINF